MNGLAPLSQENKKAIFFLWMIVTYDITRHPHHNSAGNPQNQFYFISNTFLPNLWGGKRRKVCMLCLLSYTSKNEKAKNNLLEGVAKICDWAKHQNRHSSKSIWVIKLSFCQKDLLMGESFWLVTRKLFELCLIMIFSPVANFGHHPLF